jgi:hypothetical protein
MVAALVWSAVNSLVAFAAHVQMNLPPITT